MQIYWDSQLLTEANEIQIDKICNSDIIRYRASDLLVDIDKLYNSMNIPSTLSDGLPSEKTNQLTNAFIEFHNSVKHAVELAQMSHSITAITFSDSAGFRIFERSEAILKGIRR